MKIQRTITKELKSWRNSTKRKPLVLQGARQVGKTWLLKNFGLEEFENTAYFNFDSQPELKQFFTTTKDTKRIIQNLSLVHGNKILPEKTLVIFDEIQECNEALNTLKYFCENSPEYCIACAGSLRRYCRFLKILNRLNLFLISFLIELSKNLKHILFLGVCLKLLSL